MATKTSRIGQKTAIDLEESWTHHFQTQDVDKSALEQAQVNMGREVAEASSLQVVGDVEEVLVDDIARAVRQESSRILAPWLESNVPLIVQELKDMKAKFATEDLCSGQQVT